MPIILLYILMGFILSCNTNQTKTAGNDTLPQTPPAGEITDSQTIAGKWYLIPVLASDTAGGRRAMLEFDLNENKFTGNTGCNSMSGMFISQGNDLRFNEEIVTTKMACEGYNEDVFIENLRRVNKYRIDNGTLELLYNQTVLSKWSRTPMISAIKEV